MFKKILWKRLVLLCICLGLCSTILFTTSAILPSVQARSNSASQIKILIITMFQTEATPWLNDANLALQLQTHVIPGADPTHKQLYCSTNARYAGVCLALIGVDKVNAATSMMAILRDPFYSFLGAYFLTAGTSSTSPYAPNKAVTIGSTVWANWIVDWDQSFHLLPGTVPYPYGYEPPSREFQDSLNIFRLNPTLVKEAFNVTVNTHLQLENTDPSVDVAHERALYGAGQANRKSSIANCDSAAGDNLWAGEIFSEEAQFITTTLTKGAGHNCTYEQEDTAVAGALSRFPQLSGGQFDPSKGNYQINCYLNLRAPSAFNQPYPGQALQAFIDAGVRANTMATDNLHLVGATMVNQLLKDGSCTP